jgi:hypothetical protein
MIATGLRNRFKTIVKENELRNRRLVLLEEVDIRTDNAMFTYDREFGQVP